MILHVADKFYLDAVKVERYDDEDSTTRLTSRPTTESPTVNLLLERSDWSKAAGAFMPWLVVACPNFIARQTFIIPHMRPLSNATEVTACVFAVAVKVILLYTREVLRW